MVVGGCRLTLVVEGSHSLKEKRMFLRRIKDRTRQKFNVAIAEVASQDAWQQAVLGMGVVANDKAFSRQVVEKDVSDAGKYQVSGTPTFFVNGKRVMQRDFATFQKMIDEALGSGSASASR